ncbi:MAG: hypothetical protein M1828_002037 [Chrysothrix sp. TS-e1954]|nr:MAG: hypothetical protein M1828_002037 [Chrysothrix sp. TS-e1954]
MQSINVVVLSAALAAAQFVPPPAPVELTATKSGVLPVLPPGFTGVATLEGAIINKAPVNASYVGVEGPAQVQSNLPAATYTATFPSVAFDELAGGAVMGSVVGSSKQGASGTTFTINLSNLPAEAQYGPFMYHIHDMPVPADGEYYTCDTSNPQNCQVGDLAGKHGMVMSSPTFSTSYVDPYLSTDPSSPYFFGAKSIVVHSGNTTRLTCANFMMGSNSSASGVAATTGVMPTAAATMTAASAQFTGAATKATVGGAAVGLAALAGFFL